MNQEVLRLPVEVTFEQINKLFEKEEYSKRLERIVFSERYEKSINKCLEKIIIFADTIRNDHNQDAVDQIVDEGLIRRSVEMNIKIAAMKKAFEAFLSECSKVEEALKDSLTEEVAVSMIEEMEYSVIDSLWSVSETGGTIVIPVSSVQIEGSGDPEKKYYS